MADVGISQSRRRVMTYGRTSRIRTLPTRDDASLTSLGTEQSSALKLLPTSKSWIPAARLGKPPTQKPRLAKPKDLGVFDIPSSDDEPSHRLSPAKTNTRISKRKSLEIGTKTKRNTSPDDTASVGSSDGSRKRKRASPSKQLQEELETVAHQAQPGHEPAISKLPTTRRANAPTNRHNAKAHLLGDKPVENKRKDASLRNRSRDTARSQTTFKSSSSAPAMLENLLAKSVTSAPTEKNPMNPILIPRLEDKNRPTNDEMDFEHPLTPPSKLTNRTGTPSQMLLNTPRQSRLWKYLLKDDEEPPAKTDLLKPNPDIEVESTAVKVSRAPGVHSSLSYSTAASKSMQPPRRNKLVDTLIGGRPSLEGVSEDDDESSDDDWENQDIVMEEAPYIQVSADNVPEKSIQPEVVARRPGISHVGGPRTTYADKKRSFLSVPQTDFDQILETPINDFGFGSQGQHSITHSQNSAVQDCENTVEEHPQEEEEEGPSMRSAHELQALGSNRRFVDKLDTLLDDVNESRGASRSAQRSALLELGRNMMAKDYLTRFLQLDYDQKLFSGFNGHLDSVCDFLWISLVSIIVSGGASAHVLERLSRRNVIGGLILQSTVTQSMNAIARDRKTNMSRVARDDLVKFCDSLRQESLWGSEIPRTLSPRLMSLKSLDLLVRKSREGGDMAVMLDIEHVEKLLAICREATDEKDETEPPSTQTSEAELAMSILESDSIHLAASSGESNWSSKALHGLADSTTAILGFTGEASINIESLLLRLCLNLTNNNAMVCEIFGMPEIVAALASSVMSKFAEPLEKLPEELRASLLDRLILCLGTLINLAEYSEKARLSLVANDDGLIQGLLDAFADGLKRATEVSLYLEMLFECALTNYLAGGIT